MSKFQNLSTSEKILLAEELWDSALEDEASVPLNEEHQKILDARLKEYELNSDEGNPWEVVKQRIMDGE